MAGSNREISQQEYFENNKKRQADEQKFLDAIERGSLPESMRGFGRWPQPGESIPARRREDINKALKMLNIVRFDDPDGLLGAVLGREGLDVAVTIAGRPTRWKYWDDDGRVAKIVQLFTIMDESREAEMKIINQFRYDDTGRLVAALETRQVDGKPDEISRNQYEYVDGSGEFVTIKSKFQDNSWVVIEQLDEESRHNNAHAESVQN